MGRTLFSKNSPPTGSGASEKAGSPALRVTAAPKTGWIVRDAFKLPPYCLKNLESQSGFRNGSVTVDYSVIGVRPSSGAASAGCSDASDSIGDRSRSDIAAPEDGRTPSGRSPAVADPVMHFR